MKTIEYYSKLILICISLLVPLCFTGCEEDIEEPQDEIENPADKDGDDEVEEGIPFSLGNYNPTSGNKGTVLNLYGTGFGKDVNNVKVTVNGTEAEVTEVDGYYIKAKVAKKSGTGQVKVRIGEEELVYETQFTYNFGTTVSTYFGAKIDNKSGMKYGDLHEARLWKPVSIAFDEDNSLYIVQDEDRDIAMVKDGTVSQFLDADKTDKCQQMFNIAFSKDNGYMYISNDGNASGNSNIVSIPWNESATKYDVDKLSIFWDRSNITYYVTTVAVHPITGELFAIYGKNSKIFKYDPIESKMVDTGSILPNLEGNPVNGVKTRCMLFDKAGTTVYFSSQNCSVIYKGDYDIANGTFSNIHIWVGQYNQHGWEEGQGTAAKLNRPYQMDMDEEGNLYVAVFDANRIAKITPDGTMTCYAGNGTSELKDGPLNEAQFNHPAGIQFGPDGVLYVAEYWNHTIRKIETE